MKLKTCISFVLATLLITIAISKNDTIAEDSISLKTTFQDTKKSETGESPKTIQWSFLAPENGKPFNDPFAKLTQDQLSDLSYVVRIQRLIEDEKIKADGVDAKEAANLSNKLTSEGVDIGWLIIQRERVKQIRGLQVESQSRSIAKSLGDKKVTLTGYVIPIRKREGKLTEFFLVSTIAACSHEDVPPRLKVIFVTSKSGLFSADKRTPVRVTGRIKAKATMRKIINGNGQVMVHSAYEMSSAIAELYSPAQQ
ncbi:MAG: DUF3299 domain-containing protein [Gimesia sp.]|nr:DUF3299 domain-containing protein [Gimesia sp.]